jgi:hypothetical protein
VSLFLGTSQEMEERFRGKGAKETSRKWFEESSKVSDAFRSL